MIAPEGVVRTPVDDRVGAVLRMDSTGDEVQEGTVSLVIQEDANKLGV